MYLKNARYRKTINLCATEFNISEHLLIGGNNGYARGGFWIIKQGC